MPCSKALTKHGVLAMSFVGGITYILLGIGSVSVGRLIWLLCGDFGSPRVVLGSVGMGAVCGRVGGCYFLRGGVSRPMGPTSLVVGMFPWFSIYLALIFLAFCLHFY
jgi:hypothetical protein